MAFLENLKQLPVKNVLNVAMQTAVQHLPHKSRQNEYQQPGGGAPPPNVPPRPQPSDGFAEQQQGKTFHCKGECASDWLFTRNVLKLVVLKIEIFD